MDIFTIIQQLLNDEHIDYFILKKSKIVKFKTPVTETIFCNIVRKLTDAFGNPKFVDSYYGYIWSANKKFVSFNIIETGYNIENMYIYVFKKLPLSKRIGYTDYLQLDTMITDTLKKHCFACDNFIHYRFIGHEYLYFGHGIHHECIVTLKRNCLKFSLAEKQLFSDTAYRLISVFHKKFKVNINDLETIQQALSICLSSLEHNET